MARGSVKKASARKKAGKKKATAGKKTAAKRTAGRKTAGKKTAGKKTAGKKRAAGGGRRAARAPMTFDDLVEKVLNDADFRAQLVKNPRAALESAGIPATDEMVQALNQVDYASITRVAEQFGRDEAIHPDTGFT